MAEKALKRIEDQLNCSICLDTYTDPKLLQCFHVYCQQCLVPLGVRDQQGQLSLTCPTCRQITPIPDRGVAGLQSAFHINQLLDILEESTSNPVAATPIGVTADARSVAQYCFDHVDEELKVYCETCGKLVCLQCIMKGCKHHDHDYALLKIAFTKYKEEIASSLEPMEKQVNIVKKALAELSTRYGEISDQREAIEDNVHVTFRRLREVLTVRESELIGQLRQMTQAKLKGLAAQSDQIETTLAQLNSCLHFMRESIKIGNEIEADVLKMKTSIVKQVKDLTSFQPSILKMDKKTDIVFSALADITRMCQNYGRVFESSGVPDPLNCDFTTDTITEIGMKSTAVLRVTSYDGKPFEDPIKSLECEIASKMTGACSVKRRGQSQYEISYQSSIKGRHQLHIKVEGQHVRGSPFDVMVTSSLEKLGTPIQTISGVERPWGVVINKRGELVVAGSNVYVLSSSGEKLRSFSVHGFGQLLEPRGVAVDGEGNILVADYDNYRIQKFTAEGQLLAAVITKGTKPCQFRFKPAGIAFNMVNNKVYIVESVRHQCHVLNSDLTTVGTFGKKGSGTGQFHYPSGIACGSTGKVYVADRENHRIQVFTAEGEFVRMFGRCGQGRGGLSSPSGVAVDTHGLVYVCEFGTCNVSVFTSEGQFVTSFKRMGEGSPEFTLSSGLAVDNSGVVYVCVYRNNHIQTFNFW